MSVFLIIKDETKTVMRGTGLDFDTRISTGEKEISKVSANTFFGLKQGEFITYADGKDKKVQFKKQAIERNLPKVKDFFSDEKINENYIKIYREVRSICKSFKAKKSGQIHEITDIVYLVFKVKKRLKTELK